MRLIDADDLLEDVRKHSASYFADDFAKEWVDKQPTVDAVPVVRCDGCRFAEWHSNGCIAYCTKHGADGFVADSFCSEGERKDGGHDRG